MKVEITNGNSGTEKDAVKQQYFLTASAILKYFLGKSDRLDTIIACSHEASLATTDYELYQAFGSLTGCDGVTKARITKLLENVDVLSHRKETGNEKKILTHGRVEELRKLAFKEDDKND